MFRRVEEWGGKSSSKKGYKRSSSGDQSSFPWQPSQRAELRSKGNKRHKPHEHRSADQGNSISHQTWRSGKYRERFPNNSGADKENQRGEFSGNQLSKVSPKHSSKVGEISGRARTSKGATSARHHRERVSAGNQHSKVSPNHLSEIGEVSGRARTSKAYHHEEATFPESPKKSSRRKHSPLYHHKGETPAKRNKERRSSSEYHRERSITPRAQSTSFCEHLEKSPSACKDCEQFFEDCHFYLPPPDEFADSPRGRSDSGHEVRPTFESTEISSSGNTHCEQSTRAESHIHAPNEHTSTADPRKDRGKEEENSQEPPKDPRVSQDKRAISLWLPAWSAKSTAVEVEKEPRQDPPRRPSDLVKQIVGNNSPKHIPRRDSGPADPTVRRPTRPNIRSVCIKLPTEHHDKPPQEADREEPNSHNVIPPRHRVAHTPREVLAVDLSVSSSSEDSDSSPERHGKIETAEIGIQCAIDEETAHTPAPKATTTDTEIQCEPIQWPFDLRLLKNLGEFPQEEQDLITSHEALLRSVVGRKVSPVGNLFPLQKPKPPPRPRKPKGPSKAALAKAAKEAAENSTSVT